MAFAIVLSTDSTEILRGLDGTLLHFADGEKEKARATARELAEVWRRELAGDALEIVETDWEPTHEVVFECVDLTVTRDLVMLADDGSAYTYAEWASETGADWSVEGEEWRWRDQVTPGGAPGTVTVRAL